MKTLLSKLHSLAAHAKRVNAFVFPLLLLGIFLAGWWIGRPAEAKDGPAAGEDSGTIWTCSMHPTVRQPGPGLCPICEMDLIEVSASAVGGLRDLQLGTDTVANLGLRVAPVVREPAVKVLDFLGRVAPDETRVATTTARMNGRLDRLFVDYTGITVREGDHLAEIYSPDLYVAQQELIQAKKRLEANPGDRTRQTFYRAAREKLRLLGISPDRIEAIEKQSEPSDHLTLDARQDGIVLKLHKREGEYVNTGEPLYSLADLSQVWVLLEAYEDDLPWLRFAQRVTFHAEALPGRTFTGRIAFIDPVLDETRRIAHVRVNVPNPDGLLKPGMFVRGEVHSVLAGDQVVNPSLAGKWISPMHPEIIKEGPGQCDICGMDLVPAEELGFVTEEREARAPLLVPASAVLRTGERAVVYRRLSTDEGVTFEGREIVLGPRAGDYFVVESGLREGDLVVTRGAFKLDSELQIRGKPAMMLEGASIGELPAIPPPPTVAGAWQPVLRALARARDSVEDEAEFVDHLAHAEAALRSIQPDFLPDDYAPLWREGSMKLENLLAETRLQAADGEPEIAWENLVQRLPTAAAIAGLPWTLPEVDPLPPQQLAELQAVIEAYLPVADALAHDKPDAALEQIKALETALGEADFADLGAEQAAVAEASDEESLRRALSTLTDSLTPIIRKSANDRLEALFLVHCPMAFEYTGANWLSRRPVVENPYFGSEMFACGDVVETLSLPNPSASRTEESAP